MKMLGAHMLLYSRNADADRAFLRDVLAFDSVDAGGGWLIFKLPPSEVAVHPGEGEELRSDLYLMCADLDETMKALAAKGVRCTEVAKERWGIRTAIVLPSGGRLGLYQPLHPTAI
ncbi:MAG TPA: hypothetical protein VIW45_16180 [Vicinamibacterales bacterium]|jgi:hypothetical protein